ncbi:MAG: hypothetical protein ACO1QR_00755 [Chthoniobacteraceae bacterium]
MSPRVLITGLVLLALVVALVATVMWLSFASKRVAAPAPAPSIPEAVGAGRAASTPQPASSEATDTSEESIAPSPTPERRPSTPAPRSRPPESAPAEVHGELESVGTVIRDYRNALGGNPVGTNAEITRALLGDNPKQTSFELPSGSGVNAEGEMIDRWSTPYFFHQISGTQMEIRSAGPDRRMWSKDDVVGR